MVIDIETGNVYHGLLVNGDRGLGRMEIKWVVPALQFIEHKGFMSIINIFHNVNIDINDTYSFNLITELRFMPQDASKSKIVNLNIMHGNDITKYDIPYVVPDIHKWANYVTYPYIPIVSFRFDTVGEYVFRIGVDNVFQCDNSIVAYHGGKNEGIKS